jgi:hypothetical protein
MRNIHVLNQYIYITTDEEIKEGDWFYVKTPNIQGGNVVLKSLGFGKNCWSENILTETADEKGYDPTHCVRIILTTDQDLIKDGVQAIDDEFLEWFVKNPSCEEVEVGYGWIRLTETDNEGYWVSIPDNQFEMQQEEPKQETLEEAAEKEFPLIDTEWCRTGACEEENLHLLGHRKSFMKGAKWQAKRSYSYDEVRQIAYNAYCLGQLDEPTENKYNGWIQQIKK